MISILLVNGNVALLLSRLPSLTPSLHFTFHATNLNHFFKSLLLLTSDKYTVLTLFEYKFPPDKSAISEIALLLRGIFSYNVQGVFSKICFQIDERMA